MVDSTLRDGEQAPGFAFAPHEKLRLALLLERAGVGQVEAGVPALGDDEKEAVTLIIAHRHTIQVSTWNRMWTGDIEHSLECRPDIVHICAPVSDRMLRSKLSRDRNWLECRLSETVDYALARGVAVTVGFEDASRADLNFMVSLARAMHKRGVRSVRLADTLGLLTPSAVYDMVSRFDVPVGIHAHNDFGMAVANTIAACQAGAVQVDATLFGIGERAGNCNIRLFLESYGDHIDAGVDMSQLDRAERGAQSILWKDERSTV